MGEIKEVLWFRSCLDVDEEQFWEKSLHFSFNMVFCRDPQEMKWFLCVSLHKMQNAESQNCLQYNVAERGKLIDTFLASTNNRYSTDSSFFKSLLATKLRSQNENCLGLLIWEPSKDNGTIPVWCFGHKIYATCYNLMGIRLSGVLFMLVPFVSTTVAWSTFILKKPSELIFCISVRIN